MLNDKSNEILNIILDFYSPFFDVRKGYMLGDLELSALAQFHSREEKNVFGIKVEKLGPEANEYGLYHVVDNLDEYEFERCKNIIVTAEEKLFDLHEDHGSSLISLIILADSISKDTYNNIKKYKYRKNYNKRGWALTRIAVIDVNTKEIISNNDGKDLKKLLQNALNGKKLSNC